MCAHRLPRPAVSEDNALPLADESSSDDELPDYTPCTAPPYDTDMYNSPLLTFHLWQYDRRIQMLGTSYGSKHNTSSLSSSYRITTNKFRVFSKKPEMEVLYTSSAMKQRNMAVMGFDTQGPLPWCPRAHLEYVDEQGGRTRYAMEARDFSNWQVRIGGHDYGWELSTAPYCSLVFKKVGSKVAIAKFVYSRCGTLAGRGQEVGEFVVFRDGLTVQAKGLDVVVCSLLVAVAHLKKGGRHYRNEGEDELVRAVCLAREEDQSGHRVVSVGFPLR